MKIKELIRALQKIEDQDMLVVISIDGEGNDFGALSKIDDNAMFNAEEREVSLRELTPALIPHGFNEEDVGNPETHENCVILWP